MAKTAIVTGSSGQDGSYLVELLLEKKYRVYGIDRVKSSVVIDNLKHIKADDFELIDADLIDENRINEIVRNIGPDELYNLAAQSFVPASWNSSVYTCNVNSLGVGRLLDAIRLYSPHTRFYQASSSEMFGKVSNTFQDESTYHHPRSPYGCSKSFAFNLTRNYRESYGMFACNGICFNHESERRGYQFVTRKITQSVARIKLGLGRQLVLGNMDAKRDWGYAPDYVRAMWMMLQHDRPEDYVVATGQMHSVREFTERAFDVAGVRLGWTGKGVGEKGVDAASGKTLVKVSKEFFRPAEVEVLRGNAGKIRRTLGWKPSVTFSEMVKRMVRNDMELLGH